MPDTVRRPLALILFGVLAALAGAGPLGAQFSVAYHDQRGLPEGPVGERARQVVAAVNAGDPATLQKLVETAFSPAFRAAAPLERYLDVLGNVQRRSGGIDIYGVRRYDPPRSPEEGDVIIVRGRVTDEWQGLVLQLEGGAPYRITGLQLVGARPPSDLPQPEPVDREEMVAELGAFVERLAGAGKFSGSVLLADGDEVLFSGAWGEASRRYGVDNELDTRFNLGSMNKMFTAVAVLQLAEAGKLSLDDRLSEYVGPDWLPEKVASKIQLRHLLTHTSGLGSYFTDEFFAAARDRYREIDDFQPLVRGETLAFEPGTGWQYSNTGMLLLGVVIEKASGVSYFDYVQAEVYDPAGMGSTGSFEMDVPVPNLARGYTWRGGRWIENTFLHVIKGGPAGGGFSTAPDLFRFARALSDGLLLPAAVVPELWQPRPELGSPEYGYGFVISRTPAGAPVVGHSGGFPGINSNLDIFLDSGFTAVVLSNVDEGSQIVLHQIRELLDRLEEPAPAGAGHPRRESDRLRS